MAPMEATKVVGESVPSAEMMKEALSNLKDEDLRMMAARLSISIDSMTSCEHEFRREQEELLVDNRKLNETIELMMKELHKLDICADNMVAPAIEEGPLDFVGRFWEQVKPRDNAVLLNDHVGELKKAPQATYADGTPVQRMNPVAEKLASNPYVQSGVERLGDVAKTLGPIRDQGVEALGPMKDQGIEALDTWRSNGMETLGSWRQQGADTFSTWSSKSANTLGGLGAWTHDQDATGAETADATENIGSHLFESWGQQGVEALGSLKQKSSETLNELQQRGTDTIASLSQASATETLGAIKQQGEQALGSMKQQGEETLGTLKQQSEETLGSVRQQGTEALDSFKQGGFTGLWQSHGVAAVERANDRAARLSERAGQLGERASQLELGGFAAGLTSWWSASAQPDNARSGSGAAATAPEHAEGTGAEDIAGIMPAAASCVTSAKEAAVVVEEVPSGDEAVAATSSGLEPAQEEAVVEAETLVEETKATQEEAAAAEDSEEEPMAATVLVEASITIDDGSVQLLKLTACDRCKEVAQRFVRDHSLKVWFEEPLTAYLKDVEDKAEKYPVRVEGDLMEIRQQYSSKERRRGSGTID